MVKAGQRCASYSAMWLVLVLFCTNCLFLYISPPDYKYDDIKISQNNTTGVVPRAIPSTLFSPTIQPTNIDGILMSWIYNLSRYDLVCFEDQGTESINKGGVIQTIVDVTVTVDNRTIYPVSPKVCVDVISTQKQLEYQWNFNGRSYFLMDYPGPLGVGLRTHVVAYLTHKSRPARFVAFLIIFGMIGTLLNQVIKNCRELIITGWN